MNRHLNYALNVTPNITSIVPEDSVLKIQLELISAEFMSLHSFAILVKPTTTLRKENVPLLIPIRFSKDVILTIVINNVLIVNQNN